MPSPTSLSGDYKEPIGPKRAPEFNDWTGGLVDPSQAVTTDGVTIPNAREIDMPNITMLSASYESPGSGVSTISTGKGDAGGQSYGAHQIASKTGTMTRFLESEYASGYSDRFNGLEPGTQEFNDTYTDVASEDPVGFEEAQTNYLLKSHYEPARVWAEEKGFDVENPGIASMIYSMTVQHGKWDRILKKLDPTKPAEEVIRDGYRARNDYVNGLSSVSDEWKANISGRYKKEVEDAVNIANQYSSNTTNKNDNMASL